VDGESAESPQDLENEGVLAVEPIEQSNKNEPLARVMIMAGISEEKQYPIHLLWNERLGNSLQHRRLLNSHLYQRLQSSYMARNRSPDSRRCIVVVQVSEKERE
jgi:hypothetical protein